ncbi:MAG: hypothetical protein WCR86_08590, partial [Parabacteroides sp.]
AVSFNHKAAMEYVDQFHNYLLYIILFPLWLHSFSLSVKGVLYFCHFGSRKCIHRWFYAWCLA